MHCAHIYHWLGETTCHATWQWYVVVTMFKVLIYGVVAACVFIMMAAIFVLVVKGVAMIVDTLENYHGIYSCVDYPSLYYCLWAVVRR